MFLRKTLVVAAVGTTAMLLGSGIASADISIDKTLTWDAGYPGIGTVTGISTEVVATMVNPVPPATPESTAFTIDIDIPSSVTNYLIGQGVTAVSGSGDVWITVTDPNGTKANVDASASGSSIPVPASGQDIKTTVTGTVQFPGIEDSGTASAAIYPPHVVITLTGTTASGGTVGPTTIHPTLDPSTQDPTLGSVQVGS